MRNPRLARSGNWPVDGTMGDAVARKIRYSADAGTLGDAGDEDDDGDDCAELEDGSLQEVDRLRHATKGSVCSGIEVALALLTS